MQTFAEILRAEAEKEQQQGHAAMRKRPRGGLTDLSHGTTGDVMLFNPYTVMIEDEYAICNPTHALVRDYIDRLAATVRRIGQPMPIEVVWDRERRRIVDADDGCMLRAVRQCIEAGAEIRTVAARVSPTGYSPLQRMVRSLIHIPGRREPTVLERGYQVQRIVQLFGLSIPEIARRAHTEPEIVRQWVDQTQMLPEPIRRMVEDGVLRISLACQTLRANDHNADAALAELLKAQELAGGGIIRPRMVRQVRAGEQGAPSLSQTLREVLRDSTVVHSPAVSLVTLTMSQAQYEALQRGARTGEPYNVDIQA